MLRYRCPHCSQLLQAHELRAGKKSVCNSCLASHVIPADRGAWLNEVGEPLLPRQESLPEVAAPRLPRIESFSELPDVAEPVAVGATAAPTPASAPASEAEPVAAV